MAIHTVPGPIDADELGPTSMHEHLFSDLRMWTDQPGKSAPIGPELLAELRWNAKAYPDNAVLHDGIEGSGIRPALRDTAGASEKTMDRILVDTPRRLLDR